MPIKPIKMILINLAKKAHRPTLASTLPATNPPMVHAAISSVLEIKILVFISFSELSHFNYLVNIALDIW